MIELLQIESTSEFTMLFAAPPPLRLVSAGRSGAHSLKTVQLWEHRGDETQDTCGIEEAPWQERSPAQAPRLRRAPIGLLPRCFFMLRTMRVLKRLAACAPSCYMKLVRRQACRCYDRAPANRIDLRIHYVVRSTAAVAACIRRSEWCPFAQNRSTMGAPWR